MGRDELKQMTHDKWDHSVWGSAAAPAMRAPPELFFYWGARDHWIADETRDKVMAARAYSGVKGEEWKRLTLDLRPLSLPSTLGATASQ